MAPGARGARARRTATLSTCFDSVTPSKREVYSATAASPRSRTASTMGRTWRRGRVSAGVARGGVARRSAHRLQDRAEVHAWPRKQRLALRGGQLVQVVGAQRHGFRRAARHAQRAPALHTSGRGAGRSAARSGAQASRRDAAAAQRLHQRGTSRERLADCALYQRVRYTRPHSPLLPRARAAGCCVPRGAGAHERARRGSFARRSVAARCVVAPSHACGRGQRRLVAAAPLRGAPELRRTRR